MRKRNSKYLTKNNKRCKSFPRVQTFLTWSTYMATLCTVSTLTPADETNERGKTTWEFKMSSGMQLTSYLRKGGTISGNHFHKGDDPSKNPEYIIVFFGEVVFHYEEAGGISGFEYFHVRMGESPILITVKPWAFHWMEYRSDTLFAEPRCTHFDPALPDTFGEAEWRNPLQN